MGAYVPLWVKSNHSFLEGASFPEELVERAHELGLPAVAITDRDGVYGLVRAHMRAKELGIRIVTGAQLTVDIEGDSHHVVALAKTRLGYADLCRALSLGHARCDKGVSLVHAEDLQRVRDVFFLCATPATLRVLHASRGPSSLFALCARHLTDRERPLEKGLRSVAKELGVPTVGANEVLYHDKLRRPLQDILACIRRGKTLSEAGHTICANAEHDLKPADEIGRLFADDPACLRRTLDIMEQCAFSLDDLRYRYPEEHLPSGRSEQGWLRELTFRGARTRYQGKVPADVRTQLERELQIIRKLDYGGYFLTMHEIVQYCRQQSILCQGRGSAANSAVCFCLGITAIDPVRMDLLFERFLSVERAEPPDIDLDIEHERREEVIQHVYEKYGRRHAAMVANIIRYRIRSAVRDVGKVLGLSRTDLETATRLLRHRNDVLNPELLREAGLEKDAPATHHLWSLASQIVDFPRHLSIHPGGFLLGHRPVDEIVPIEPATMEGRTVIQWDKYDVDNLALFKVDLLGLGALTCIHHAFDLLLEHKGKALEIATVPVEDKATYDMVSRGDTVGVFQIESRAQMAMLPRLRPRTFYDLVIEVAIVRPGPIQGDMVHPYLRRRKGEEEIVYPHPKLERILKKTLGVPIFQEQVMKLAVDAAGYTPGEADQLRRDMAAWRKSGCIEKHRTRMIPRMLAEGIPEEFAERVFSQIRGFGEYGFPESHAASFALLAYVTAWLRCHHHDVFTCAILNAQPMGFYTPATLVEDAKRHGVEVRPVNINKSQWNCTLTPVKPAQGAAHGASPFSADPLHDVRGGQSPVDDAKRRLYGVRMGLRYVKGLGVVERERLETVEPPYPNLATFVRQTRLNRKAMHALAEAGAFECFGLNRRDAIWQVRSLSRFAQDALPLEPASSQISFASLASDDQVLWDYRSSHHSTRGHPMQGLRHTLRSRGIPEATRVHSRAHGDELDYVGMVICRQRPGTASGVTFFTLEDETGFVNVVVWKQVFDRHAALAKTAALLGVSGEIQKADGVIHLIAKSLWAPDVSLA
ncbi:MAG: error-prone DNA polymerase, partial [Deltaproteobacteria bacterium]|nr:error-prone DNA polymerase [Deltaproteobacteria bacterium]